MSLAMSVVSEAQAGIASKVVLSVTQNGYQWNSIHLSRSQLKIMLRLIQIHLRTGEPVIWKYSK